MITLKKKDIYPKNKTESTGSVWSESCILSSLCFQQPWLLLVLQKSSRMVPLAQRDQIIQMLCPRTRVASIREAHVPCSSALFLPPCSPAALLLTDQPETLNETDYSVMFVDT